MPCSAVLTAVSLVTIHKLSHSGPGPKFQRGVDSTRVYHLNLNDLVVRSQNAPDFVFQAACHVLDLLACDVNL